MRLLNIHGPDDVRLDQVAAPTPGEHDVVLRVAACGICGSDLGFIRRGGTGHNDPNQPMPLGHEAAGVVEAIGPAVSGIEPGMRVILNPMIADSVIGNGGPEGAFGDRLLVRGAQLGSTLYPMPDHMDFEVAALAEPLGVALHAVNRAQVRPGEKAVVFGCGPIGLGVVFWLGRRGMTDIVAVDPRGERLEKARQLGATATIQPGAEDVAAKLAELHGEAAVLGMPAVGSDVFIDAAGAASVVPDTISMAKPHARLVVVAVHAEPVQIDLLRFLASEITMTSSIGYPDEFPEVIATLGEMGEEARRLISHRFAFDQIFEALDVARTPASAKVMVHFDVA